MYSYVATAHEPTAVTHSIVAHFMTKKSKNLIVAKRSRIEIYEIETRNLRRVNFFELYGTIVAIQALPRESPQKHQYIFVLTERNQFFVLEYNKRKNQFVTRSEGRADDRVGRPVEVGTRCAVDPAGSVIGLHIYDGLVKMIPIKKGMNLETAYNTRIDELQVIDMTFLYGSRLKKPQLCILYKEIPMGQANMTAQETYFIKLYTLDLKAKELVYDGSPKYQTNRFAEKVVAIPFGGVMVVGDSAVEYYYDVGKSTSSSSSASKTSGENENRASTTLATSVESSSSGSSSRRSHRRPFVEKAMGHCEISAIGAIDQPAEVVRTGQARFLFSDARGSLSVVVINRDTLQILTQAIGMTSVASSISYLDSGVVFVGSGVGESQLVKLSADQEANANGSGLEVLETYTNLGPIIDMVAIDLHRHGQHKLVTCSGAHHDGSLRVVSNGITFVEQAEIDLPGVKGMWALRPSSVATHDKMLVQSFVGETRILGIEGEEMAETSIPSFDGNAQTLFCGNAVGDHFVQVTPQSVRLVSCTAPSHALADEWIPDANCQITVACGNSSQIVVALTGGTLVYVEIDASGKLHEATRTEFENEIACVDASPVSAFVASDEGDDSGESKSERPERSSKTSESSLVDSTRASYVFVSLWKTVDVRVLSLPDLTERHSSSLGGDVLPRSLLCVELEQSPYLLVGLADGHLVSYRLNTSTGELYGREKILLGRHPIVLRPFQVKGANHVFACCDRPMVLYSSKGRLSFVNINLADEVTFMSPFHAPSFPDCIALSSESSLAIGEIDTIQKLHVDTLPLYEQPRRIAYQESTRTICVCTHRIVHRNDAGGSENVRGARHAYTVSGDDEGRGFVRLFASEENLADIGSFELDPFEHSFSSCCVKFNGDSREYFAIGTAYILDGQEEPDKGRILIFSVRSDARSDAATKSRSTDDMSGDDDDDDGVAEAEVAVNHLVKVGEICCDGCVYALQSHQGRLVAGINAHVAVFEWQTSGGTSGDARYSGDDVVAQRRLRKKCSAAGHFVSLSIRCRGDHIVVADLMKSIRVLKLDSEGSQLVEVAHDIKCNWMSEVECLSDDVFIGAEDNSNLFCVRLNSEAETEEEQSRLKLHGEYHVGMSINKFVEGTMVMQPPRSGADRRGNASSSKSVEGAAGEESPAPRLMFGTVSGAIGVVISLSERDYALLNRLQVAMTHVIKGIGGLKHEDYRAFSNENRKVPKPMTGFVDGDLVELILDADVPEEKRKEIYKMLVSSEKSTPTPPFEDVIALVEKISRLH